MSYFRQTANYQVSISESSVSTQTLSSTNQKSDISNSTIAYTPHPLAKKVIYEGSIYLTTTKRLMCAISLYHYTGGSWTEVNENNRKDFTSNHYGYGNSDEHTVYLRYVLDPWQGEKSLKMRVSNYTSEWNVRLHRTARWEGSTGTDAYIMPQFMMYSVL